MRSYILPIGVLLASAASAQSLNMLSRRQDDGAFEATPGDTTTSCTLSGMLDCGTEWCYDPTYDETCCAGGYPCPADSFCIGNGLCCPNTKTQTECLAEMGSSSSSGSSGSSSSSGTSSDDVVTTSGTGSSSGSSGSSSSGSSSSGSSSGSGSSSNSSSSGAQRTVAALGSLLAAGAVAVFAL